jgi:vitamin B12 transporter
MNKSIKLSIVATLLATLNLYGQKTEEFGTITVYGASKSEQSIKDITSNVEVVTSYELEEKGAKTLTEALDLLSGVSFTNNGGLGATSSIQLRGMGSNRTLVLIDGVRLQDPSSTSGANIAHIMMSDIEKIEVIKGAQSGVWGADAAAGVVNIITKSAKDGFSGSILVEAGSFDTKKLGLEVSNKEKLYDVKLSAQKTESDGYSVQAPYGTDLDTYEDDAYENTTVNLKTGLNISDDARVSLNIMAINAIKEYDSYGLPNDTTMKSDIENRLYSLSYQRQMDKHNIALNLEKSDFEREEIGTTYGVKEFNGEHNNIELKDNFKYSDKSFAILGVGYSIDDVEYVQVGNTKGEKKNKDIYGYVTNSNKFDNTILTQSIRYDKYDSFDSKFTGKLGLKHNYTKDSFVSSNVGTGYNIPNVLQELNPWGATNTDLNPENSKSMDISFGHKEFKFTYFYQKVTDLIEWNDPDGFTGPIVASYKNLDGESTFRGFELDYETELFSNLLMGLNYTRLKATDKDGQILKRRPSETLKFGFDYYGVDSLHIGLNGEYIGDRYESDNEQGTKTGSYTVADLVVNYDLKKDIKVYGKVDNITDKYYQTVEGYTTSPRAFYVGLKYNF